MSNEAKIGFAVAAAALVAVLWFVVAGRQGPEETGSRPAKAKAARVEKPANKSDRARDRLAQLRAERLAAGGRPDDARDFPERLPKSVFDSAARRPAAGIGAGGDPSAARATPEPDEMDFDTLRDMALIDDDPDNRIAAIWLLASLDDEKPVLPVLTQALSDENPEVRMAAIQALSEFSEEPPIDSLNLAMQDSDAEIRFEALSIAAEMTDERVQPLIQKALDDPDEDVRSLAEGLADMEDTYQDAPPTAAAPAATPK